MSSPFSVGLIAGSMTIGPIIPPNIIMVVYGIAASVPIGSLFIGGIVPGILTRRAPIQTARALVVAARQMLADGAQLVARLGLIRTRPKKFPSTPKEIRDG